MNKIPVIPALVLRQGVSRERLATPVTSPDKATTNTGSPPSDFMRVKKLECRSSPTARKTSGQRLKDGKKKLLTNSEASRDRLQRPVQPQKIGVKKRGLSAKKKMPRRVFFWLNAAVHSAALMSVCSNNHPCQKSEYKALDKAAMASQKIRFFWSWFWRKNKKRHDKIRRGNRIL